MRFGLHDRGLVGDLRQLASVRRITLDEGPEKGVSALAFSTGGGLDFWVLTERAMDIGPLWRDGRPVAWQSPAGFRRPELVDSEWDSGFGFERGFSGFLMTCGLDHSRKAAGGRPQHGRLPFLPARLTAHGEVWDSDAPYLFCEGEVVQWRHGGESLRLKRRIEAPIGGRSLHISDVVENCGAEQQRHALLYHINIGYPALQPGAEVYLDGAHLLGPLALPEIGAQPAAFSSPAKGALARCALSNGVAPVIELGFSADTLPHLQLWHDPRPNSFVLALEPCTSARPADGMTADEPVLAPGERRRYRLDFTFAAASS